MLGMNNVPILVLCFPQVENADELSDGDPHGGVGHVPSRADTAKKEKDGEGCLAFRVGSDNDDSPSAETEARKLGILRVGVEP